MDNVGEGSVVDDKVEGSVTDGKGEGYGADNEVDVCDTLSQSHLHIS